MLTSDFYAKHMLPAKPEGGCMPLAPAKGCVRCHTASVRAAVARMTSICQLKT